MLWKYNIIRTTHTPLQYVARAECTIFHFESALRRIIEALWSSKPSLSSWQDFLNLFNPILENLSYISNPTILLQIKNATSLTDRWKRYTKAGASWPCVRPTQRSSNKNRQNISLFISDSFTRLLLGFFFVRSTVDNSRGKNRGLHPSIHPLGPYSVQSVGAA